MKLEDNINCLDLEPGTTVPLDINENVQDIDLDLISSNKFDDWLKEESAPKQITHNICFDLPKEEPEESLGTAPILSKMLTFRSDLLLDINKIVTLDESDNFVKYSDLHISRSVVNTTNAFIEYKMLTQKSFDKFSEALMNEVGEQYLNERHLKPGDTYNRTDLFEDYFQYRQDYEKFAIEHFKQFVKNGSLTKTYSPNIENKYQQPLLHTPSSIAQSSPNGINGELFVPIPRLRDDVFQYYIHKLENNSSAEGNLQIIKKRSESLFIECDEIENDSDNSVIKSCGEEATFCYDMENSLSDCIFPKCENVVLNKKTASKVIDFINYYNMYTYFSNLLILQTE